MRALSLIGVTFGQWTVVERAPNNRFGTTMWRCRCTCGVERVLRGTSLRQGDSASCGCTSNDRISAANTTHGHASGPSKSPTYQTWMGMLQRCKVPQNANFADYGGRGITVCDRWTSFESFLEDMGERPTGTSIERRDNAGHYEPSNCYWATKFQQANNRRSNRLIEHAGRSQTVSEWAKEAGITPQCLFKRLGRGDAVAKALRGLNVRD